MRRDEPAALEGAAVFSRHRPVAVGCVGLTGFNSRWFFCWNCSTSSANLCQVRAISFRVDRTLALGALSAICRHSRACRLHSLDVIIAARGLGGRAKPCRGTRAAGFHQADLCRLTPLALPVGLFCDCGTGKFPYRAARL